MKTQPVCEDKSPAREKYWTELDVLEKCERIRRIIKSQAVEIRELRGIVSALEVHEHAGRDIVLPLRSVSLYEQRQRFEELYF